MTASHDRFDVVVIGGGINGAAIARDAALRGMSVALVEQDDLGSGTTAWSSRLIHGGLRYLEHGEWGLVRESLLERERLLRNARHLVHPLAFLLPLYQEHSRAPRTIRAGMCAYDLLSARKSLPRHTLLGRAAARALEPGLAPDGLRGAALYWDAQAEYPERLAVETALDARAHGAVLLTHTSARLAADGVHAVDVSGDERLLRARVIVNAAGPWLDRVPGVPAHAPLLGGTKGSHVVVERFDDAPPRAVYAEAASDGRPFFIIPWLGRLLLGATDTRYVGDPGAARVDAREVAYLLDETQRIFPEARLTASDVRFAYAGIRPLPFQPQRAPGGVSRRHFIRIQWCGATPLLAIIGGKLTTHRQLAEEVLDHMAARLNRRAACVTRDRPLPGAVAPEVMARELSDNGVSAASAGRLARIYGRRALDVLALACADPWLAEPLASGAHVLRAEVAHALHCEEARTLTDIFMRRVMLGLEPDRGLPLVDAALTVAQRVSGWSAARAAAERDEYRAYLARFDVVAP